MKTRILMLLFTLALPSGCASDATQGWTLSNAYNDKWSTIAIPIVKNLTYEREMGYLLTNALVREVENRTPWRITSPAEADTLLEVEITSVELQALSQSRLTKLNQEKNHLLNCLLGTSIIRNGKQTKIKAVARCNCWAS